MLSWANDWNLASWGVSSLWSQSNPIQSADFVQQRGSTRLLQYSSLETKGKWMGVQTFILPDFWACLLTDIRHFHLILQGILLCLNAHTARIHSGFSRAADSEKTQQLLRMTQLWHLSWYHGGFLFDVFPTPCAPRFAWAQVGCPWTRPELISQLLSQLPDRSLPSCTLEIFQKQIASPPRNIPQKQLSSAKNLWMSIWRSSTLRSLPNFRSLLVPFGGRTRWEHVGVFDWAGNTWNQKICRSWYVVSIFLNRLPWFFKTQTCSNSVREESNRKRRSRGFSEASDRSKAGAASFLAHDFKQWVPVWCQLRIHPLTLAVWALTD